VFGGKITTYRRLAEDAVNLLGGILGVRAAPWTRGARLPGGDLPDGSFAVFLRTVERRYAWLPVGLRLRWAHAYGTRIERVVGGASRLTDLGQELLPQLFEREVEYLCREEFARSAQDILWRRSKLGLHLLNTDLGPLERWLAAHAGAERAQAEPQMRPV
jgi:glycerol-3-phosphate dehydrogenase